MRISDWSSDVCSSDLLVEVREDAQVERCQIVEFQVAVGAPDDGAAAVVLGADAGPEPLVEDAAVELDEVAVAAAAAPRRRAVQQVEFGNAGADRHFVGPLERVVERDLPRATRLEIGIAVGMGQACRYV